ncbi:MAG TPA: hypothetical protein VET24_10855 [Actinomycetota bacterium]|nr:hypothetical protein [Actinomycetota bacterium]
MWLVLCDDHDLAAQWAFLGLAERGLAPLELVTSGALAHARRWVHRVTTGGAHVEVTLHDGRTFDSRRVRGALNRLVGVYNAGTFAAAAGDREYATQEFYAFLVSSLHCLPGSVLNPPGYLGLSGRCRHESEWAVLAASAGLPTTPYRMPAPPVPPLAGRPARRSVVVLGDLVFGVPDAAGLRDGCRRLAALAGTELLGVDLEVDDAGGWRFAAATPQPDLRLGGTPFLEALAARLRQ